MEAVRILLQNGCHLNQAIGTEYFGNSGDTLFFSLLAIPTNALYIYIYIYISIIFISTPTCFDASASSAGSLNFVFAKLKKFFKLLKL